MIKLLNILTRFPPDLIYYAKSFSYTSSVPLTNLLYFRLCILTRFMINLLITQIILYLSLILTLYPSSIYYIFNYAQAYEYSPLVS